MNMPSKVGEIWNDLEKYFNDKGRALDLRGLFKENPDRFKDFSLELADPHILLDYSKNLVDVQTMELLFKLARDRGVETQRDRMFRGEPINNTEGRAVLHVALRNVFPATAFPATLADSGDDVMPAVEEELNKMARLAKAIRDGVWKGSTDRRITDVVNIGIGGSDLGPVMVCEALKSYAHPEIRSHFVSNIDGSHLEQVIRGLDAETTLFIVVSKTFTTAETMTNAHSARHWLLHSLRGKATKFTKTESAVESGRMTTEEIEMVKKHFIAVSTNIEAVKAFGIAADNVVQFWDWVGGRYSLWSAVGLIIMISVGEECFRELLHGAHQMDCHFLSTPLEHNIPVILALLGIWYNNFWQVQTHAILPYEQYLHRLPAYLQQADMESNGKSVTHDGCPVAHQTGPIVWGEPGTNGQHAFFQLLHQGTKLVSADFLVGRQPATFAGEATIINEELHHRMLLANCVAQTEALMKGRTLEEASKELANLPEPHRSALLPHKVFPGNRPTTTIIYDRLTPRTLGALIAMYEHKIFVQGVIWDVNSFDQWGVELGKQLATTILKELTEGKITNQHDPSTMALLNYIIKQQ